MLEKLMPYWLKMHLFKKHFMSIVLTDSDTTLVKPALESLPLKVFDMGAAAVVPTTMKDMPKKSEKEDDVPYRLFYVVVERTIKNPNDIKKQIVEKLTETLLFRWCYGTDTQFD
ncbi:MAG: hypothetical protein KGI50_00935 [Patescibacteria group bacterium]|nr:hypothetical protein [Patescibacteria group bacterium]MDE2438082.1 hypothetical protein [Patescibacteria group bacterium]